MRGNTVVIADVLIDIIVLKMKKEDYQSHNNGIPIDLIFIPETLQIDFKQKIKLQVAFYRNSKVCKSSPSKFLKSNLQNSLLPLQPQKLHFCTTIGYDMQSRTFESKIVHDYLTQINVQLAYQADAQKQTIDAKIDLRDILVYQASFQKSGLVVVMRDDVRLGYGVIGRITNFRDGQGSVSPLKNVREKSQPAPKKQQSPIPIPAAQKHTSPINEKPQVKPQPQPQPQSHTQAQTLQSLHSLQQSHKILQQSHKNLQQKHRQTLKKFQSLTEQHSNLKLRLKQSQSSNEQKSKQIGELERLLQRVTEEKNLLLGNLGKKGIQEQELMRKVQIGEKHYEEVEYLKGLNVQYRAKIQELKRSEAQARTKYQQSEKKNLSLIAELTEANYNCEKAQKELEKSQKLVEKLQQQLNQNSPQDNPRAENDVKAKDIEIQKLTKTLETKEEVIKILKRQTQMKKTEQNEDINFLKKQNKELKEQIQKHKDPKKDSLSLELKIQNQKLKKQCLQAKRQQKKMLSEKSDIENKNKQMHLEIVRLKETIGKILNIVQEEGTSDLFTQIADCVA